MEHGNRLPSYVVPQPATHYEASNPSWMTQNAEEERRVEPEKVRRARARANRKAKDQILRDMGMVKVRGNLGGTYWE